MALSNGRKAGAEGKTEEDRKGMRKSEGLCYGEAWLQLNPEIVIKKKKCCDVFDQHSDMNKWGHLNKLSRGVGDIQMLSWCH